MSQTKAASDHHQRLSVGLLLAAFVVLAATAWWYYDRQRIALDAAARREVTAVCEARSSQVALWRQERLGDGRLMSSLRESRAAALIVSGQETADRRAEVLAGMNALRATFGYKDAMLVDADGNSAIRLDNERTEQARIPKRQRAELAKQALSAKGPVLSDINLENRERTPLMTLTAPIGDVGAMILEIDPQTFLYPYLRSWPTVRRTGETYLARLEGNEMVYLSERRFIPGAPGETRRSVQDIQIPSPSELAEGVLITVKDYRGEPVLAHVRSVPGSPWLMIAKVDEAEVRESMNRLGWELAGVLALIAIASGSALALIRKSHQLRVQHESEERFRSIANETPSLLWMAAPDGSSLLLNRRLGLFIGVDWQQPVIQWTDFVHPDDVERARAESDAAFQARARFSFEMRLRRADGVYRWVVSEGLPRTAPNGEFLGFAGSLLDITERKVAEQRLRDANEVLAEEVAERTQKELEVRALSARLIHGQEEERRRLSRELHDDLSQQIAALSIATGNLKREIPAERNEARAQTDRIQQKLIELSESVRRLSHELHPAVLQHSGLGPALQGFCREFGEVSGIDVKLRVVGDFSTVRPDAALAVFRIVQEALQNVAKHAQVNQAEVELIRTGEAIRLTVSDNGVGFEDPEESRAGLGLVSIRERTRLAEGSVEMESAPGAGTRLTVRIPDEGSSATVAGA